MNLVNGDAPRWLEGSFGGDISQASGVLPVPITIRHHNHPDRPQCNDAPGHEQVKAGEAANSRKVGKTSLSLSWKAADAARSICVLGGILSAGNARVSLA